MFENMSEEKMRRTVAGMVIAGTLLVVMLLAVIVYQFVSMGQKRAKAAELQEEIKYYQELKDQKEEELGVYQTDWKKEQLARRWGYVYPEDKTPEDLNN